MPAKLSLHRYKCSYGHTNKNYTFELFNYTLRFWLFNTFYFNSSTNLTIQIIKDLARNGLNFNSFFNNMDGRTIG
ncbi:hypothetical protein FHR29_001406 [Sphingobacterium sp. JUb56]|nr:hypothetical protein [Sphingobacterium sp. JUb56]